MDASGQVRHDHACRQFYLARLAGRRARPGWAAPQAKGAGLDENVQFGEKAVADLSDRRRVVRLRTSGVSGRDIQSHRQWKEALGGLTRPLNRRRGLPHRTIKDCKAISPIFAWT